MTHIDLAPAGMKPAAIVRYEINQGHTRAKQFIVASTIAAAMIVVMAAMFLSALH